MADVEYTEHGHVGLITLNRPDVHNALRRGTYDELTGLVRDATARALVITGAGPSFCSGDDVRELMKGGTGAAPRPAPRLTPAADALLHTDIPVVAAVNGPAVGWGMELALMALPTALELGVWVSTSLGELFTTEDHREGVRSFLERREPRYVGR
jgi:enoyl-CoA hydratase/carnithine racemase